MSLWYIFLPALVVGVLAARSFGLLRLTLAGDALDVGLRPNPAAPERWRLHLDLGEGWLTYVMLTWLVLLTSGTVAASRWLGSSATDVLVPLSLAGVAVTLVLAKVAPRGTTYWLAVEAGGVIAIFLATSSPEYGEGLWAFPGWIAAISHTLTLAVLVCLAGMTWLSVGWTTFWVARRHNFVVAVAPMGVVLVIEVINDPAQQDLYLRAGAWVVLAVLFSLRLNVVRLIRRWRDAGNEQLAWSVSIEGMRALAVMVVLAFVIPPLSTIDISGRLFPTPGRSGDGLTPHSTPDPNRRNTPVAGFAETGYTESVHPGGTLNRSQNPVLKVKVRTTYSGTIYWRGVALYDERDGNWDPSTGRGTAVTFAAGQEIESTSPELERTPVNTTFTVVGLPQTTIFSGGEPETAQLTVVGWVLDGLNGAGQPGRGAVTTMYANPPISGGGVYSVLGDVSTAGETELRNAGLSYPPAITQLTSANIPRAIDPNIHNLALQWTKGATNPYDKALAIQTNLRSALFRYELAIPTPPAGVNPVANFLLNTHTGYCEYFASAMGEMVRSLGIPVRLVNGYSMGTSDDKPGDQGNFVVRAADAHTWVEVYFPSYGWVPFEPTNDGQHPPIQRGNVPEANPTPGSAQPSASPVVVVPTPPSNQIIPGLPVNPLPVLGGLAVLGAAWLALAALRGPANPGDIGVAWRRIGWIARRARVQRRAAETPLELARRLGAAMPRYEAELVTLGAAYSRDRYARTRLDPEALAAIGEDWARLRQGLVLSLLLGRRHGALEPGPRGLPAAGS